MEQLTAAINKITVEENTPATVIQEVPTATNNVEAATPTKNAQPEKQQEHTNNINLLYEQSLGFIPTSLRGNRDPRYVYAKFPKEYKQFDFTHEDILQILEEANLHKYL